MWVCSGNSRLSNPRLSTSRAREPGSIASWVGNMAMPNFMRCAYPYGASVNEPTLSRRALQRAVLARQLLLDRAPGTVPEALGAVGGLQAQYAPSMYVGLWS